MTLLFISFPMKACYVQPGLPAFFCAEGADLIASVQCAIDALGQECRSGYMVVRDETVYAKTFSLL